jgi:hypothetical protein
LIEPLEDFAIALASFELFSECIGVDTGKFEESLVKRTIVMIFTILAVDGGAPFIDAARKQSIAS